MNVFRFGVTLDGVEGESVWGDMTCRMQGSLVGNQNVSFIVNEDYGRSLSFNYMYLLSQSNKLYMLQTYAGENNIINRYFFQICEYYEFISFYKFFEF